MTSKTRPDAKPAADAAPLAKPPTARRRPAAPDDVAAFVAALGHPAAALINLLRQTMLAVDSRIGEGIKWNSPSFRINEHFATMNLREKQGIALILHFGARKNEISNTGVAIADPAGLLQWLAKDRAVIRFRDEADLAGKQAAFTLLIREWIRHVP